MVYQFTSICQKPYKTFAFPAFLKYECPGWRLRSVRQLMKTAAGQLSDLSTKLGFTANLNNATNESVDDWLTTCEAAARAGGQELRDWQGRFQTRRKGVHDLVTDADLASQDAIHRIIATRFPEHAFVGEEQGTES